MGTWSIASGPTESRSACYDFGRPQTERYLSGPGKLDLRQKNASPGRAARAATDTTRSLGRLLGSSPDDRARRPGKTPTARSFGRACLHSRQRVDRLDLCHELFSRGQSLAIGSELARAGYDHARGRGGRPADPVCHPSMTEFSLQAPNELRWVGRPPRSSSALAGSRGAELPTECTWSHTSMPPKGSREVALARKSDRKRDVHQRKIRMTQEVLRPVDSPLGDIAVRTQSRRPFE